MVIEMIVQAARTKAIRRASSIPPCLQKRRARAEGRARASDALVVARPHLRAHELEDLVPRARERWVGGQVLPDAAVPRDVDPHRGLERPGTPREDAAPVPEERR